MMPACIVGNAPTGGETPPYGPPIAHWTSSETVVPPFTTVFFYDDSSGTPTSWEWRFGTPSDPVFSIERNTQWYFTAEGTYNITLVATNVYGTSYYVSVIHVVFS